MRFIYIIQILKNRVENFNSKWIDVVRIEYNFLPIEIIHDEQ